VSLRVLLLVVVVAVVGVLLPATAAATVPTWTNPCSGDIDVAACERLTFLAETADAQLTATAEIDAKLDGPLSVTCDATCASSATTATLSTSDHDALNLTWWGIWALVGLMLVLLIADRWFKAWSYEGKLGNG
jgi:hypothetical protein